MRLRLHDVENQVGHTLAPEHSGRGELLQNQRRNEREKKEKIVFTEACVIRNGEQNVGCPAPRPRPPALRIILLKAYGSLERRKSPVRFGLISFFKVEKGVDVNSYSFVDRSIFFNGFTRDDFKNKEKREFAAAEGVEDS